jgi:hypothetical protein
MSKPVLQTLTNGEGRECGGLPLARIPTAPNEEGASSSPHAVDDMMSRITLANESDSLRQDVVRSNNSSVESHSSGTFLPSIGKSSLKGSDSEGSRQKHMTVRFELPPEKSVPSSKSKGMLANALTTDYFIMDSPKFGPLASRSDRHCTSAVDITRIKLGSVMPNYAQYNERTSSEVIQLKETTRGNSNQVSTEPGELPATFQREEHSNKGAVLHNQIPENEEACR